MAAEILARPTNNSMTVHAVAGFAADAFVKYGAVSVSLTNQTPVTAFPATGPIVVKIDTLQANTKYYYRFCYRRQGTLDFIEQDEHSFYTQRSPGSTFTFTVTADYHLYDRKWSGNLIKVTMQNAVKDNADFYLELGDTYGDDHKAATITQEEENTLHRNVRPYVGIVAQSTPFMFCMGNHEGESGYYLLQTPPNNIAVYASLARKFYYANPVPDGFYTGNAAEEDYGIKLPENYYAWKCGGNSV